MPTYKLLKTTIGGYEVFNLTSAIIASFFIKDDISSQIILGTETVFNTTSSLPYVPGTLEVFLDGILQTGVPGYITETNPALGIFTLSNPPSIGSVLVIRFIQA